jgi:predicted metal-dependent phosphoesterase TrpH
MEIRRAVAAEQGDEVQGSFAQLQTVLDTVHAAGGVLLIAHVGKYFPDQRDPQLALIEEVLAAGVDGFELYHPVNCAQPHFDELIACARGLDCALSGGSDCHHAGTKIGKAIGSCTAPDWVLERLDRCLARV